MSNRPEDSAFKQQRLKAWQPILTPVWVIVTFLLIGIIFIPIGIVLKAQSDAAFEQVIVYDGAGATACAITTQNQGYNAIQAGTPMNCVLNFTFTQDIAETNTVYLYYQLTNFFQNHRRYVKSRSDSQVGGAFVSNSGLSSSCDPNASYVSAASGLIYAPCGLVATSHFNDAYFLQSGPGALDESNIAWPTDIKTKFRNPTNDLSMPVTQRPLNNWAAYQYVWQTYDQMSCYTTAGALSTCEDWATASGFPAAFGNGCARCLPGDIPRYEGGVPPPGFPLAFNTSIDSLGNDSSTYGFRDEHFVVWMRTAGLPTFRKLYGTLTPPAGGFRAGQRVSFEVVANFEVASFGGTKALILGTQTSTGGKSDVLGIAYLVVGSLCVAVALAFLAKHLIAPRKLGDPSFIGKRVD